MPPLLQPFLHDLVTVLAAPTQVLSDRAGDIGTHPDSPGAEGLLHADVRVLSGLRLLVDGHRPEHIATTTDAGTARFTAVLRRLAAGSGVDPSVGPDPLLRLDRRRTVQPGRLSDELTLTSHLPEPVSFRLEVQLCADGAPVEAVKAGQRLPLLDLRLQPDGDRWSWPVAEATVSLDAPGGTVDSPDPRLVRVGWAVTLPAYGSVVLGLVLRVSDRGSVVVASPRRVLDPQPLAARTAAALQLSGVLEPRLESWLQRSLADLDSLAMATADHPDEPFLAAGAPWYLTLFGRDSLWAARLLLPLDRTYAEGTLRTLARLQGRVVDPSTGEAPGKIIHELRRVHPGSAPAALPPRYYGTVDATPLWVCLLHDAWRCGLDPAVVQSLLPTLHAALDWLSTSGDPDGDGFLEYVDESGRGLVNQGWKDSSDAIRFADGSIATGPVALCEVQGYAHEAAVSGADLLDAFDEPGGDWHRDWASGLAERFRARFWCGAGPDRYPALALDGRKRRVDSLTSNIGHLLGTGLLNAEEEDLVAYRLTGPELDSGLGLRTMSSADAGFSPLSYHCGSVWPHDTAIAVAGLVRAGFATRARGLLEGLLAASVAFDGRLPELWSGEGLPVPYPAACRPQAWSAAAAVAAASALAAVAAALDVPDVTLLG